VVNFRTKQLFGAVFYIEVKWGFNIMYARYIKRILDFILSLIAMLLLWPILIIVSVLIKLDSSGPVFYTQLRPGKNQKLFKLYKFRTMIQGADKYQKVGIEVKQDDSRITFLGRFLRRTKIDELPQLINILKGDMSIVGPRPSLPEYLEQYEDWELERFLVRPGLTGLAQINGNIYLKREEKSVYDVKYIKEMSFFLDAKIIIKTVLIVLCGEDKFINKTDAELSKRSIIK